MRFAGSSATKHMRKEYQDVIGDKCVRNNACNLLTGMNCLRKT